MEEKAIQKACDLAQNIVHDLMECGILCALKEEPYYSRTMEYVRDKAREFMLS